MSGVSGKFLAPQTREVIVLSLAKCILRPASTRNLRSWGTQLPPNRSADSCLVNICQVYGKWKSSRLSRRAGELETAASKWLPVIWVRSASIDLP